jgi:hypothetical protein
MPRCKWVPCGCQWLASVRCLVCATQPFPPLSMILHPPACGTVEGPGPQAGRGLDTANVVSPCSLTCSRLNRTAVATLANSPLAHGRCLLVAPVTGAIVVAVVLWTCGFACVAGGLLTCRCTSSEQPEPLTTHIYY